MNKTPNILLITADQLRVNEIGFMSPGSVIPGKPNTPNLDAMASRGTAFGLAVTPSPVCTPARTSLFSGQYPSRCMGPVINAPEPVAGRVVFPDKTLPEMLADAGYGTALTGKWHIHTTPMTAGFAECAYPDIFHLNRDQNYNFEDGSHRKIPGCAYGFELETTEKFLAKKHDKPFFLSHNISLPHMPYFDVDGRFKHMYTPEEAAKALPGNAFLPDNRDFVENWFKIYYYDAQYYKYHRTDCAVLPEELDSLPALYAMYRGMVAACDEQVGRLLGMLKKYGYNNDTVVIFTSDHGDNMGSHGRFNKDLPYDESARVPLIFKFGKNTLTSERGRYIDGIPVSLVDIMPTIADMLGLGCPQCDGVSLLPLISGGGIGRDYVFTETPVGEFAFRDERYLYSIMTDVYTREIKNDAYLFIDTKRDPLALDNIAARSRSHEEDEIMERLRALTVEAHKSKRADPSDNLGRM